MMPRREPLFCSARILLVIAGLAAAPEARADSAGEARERKAAELYKQGTALLQDRKPAEALVALDASLALSRGLSAELVRAHALRLLGRRGEAMVAYTDVERDAGERARGGDADARAILADAGRWTALLRAELGEVSVEVRGAPVDVAILIDEKPARVERDEAGVARARLWHEPGAVRVTARAPGGAERAGSADVTVGQVAAVKLDLTGPAKVAAPSGPPVGTWVAWGAGAVSLGVGIAFGAMAADASSKLETCAPACPESLRSDAEAGKSSSLVANIAFGVGAAAVVAGAVVWIVAPRRSPAPAAAGVFISATPGGGALGLSGVF